MMLAEASKPELLVKAFTTLITPWPLLATMNDVLIHGQSAGENPPNVGEDNEKQFPLDALHMRISDDYGEARAVARLWPPTVRSRPPRSCFRSMVFRSSTTAWKSAMPRNPATRPCSTS